MRTFSRAHWVAAQEAWTAGQFSSEWRDFRHQAAMRGMIYPPDGDRHDSWDDEEPSQRAMLIRAIRESPQLLSTAIGRSESWDQVIAYVLARRDEWRDELDARDRDIKRQRAVVDFSPREASMSIKAIVQRIADS